MRSCGLCGVSEIRHAIAEVARAVTPHNNQPKGGAMGPAVKLFELEKFSCWSTTFDGLRSWQG